MSANSVKKAGVIGWPVSHSLSPRLHSWWIKKYAIAATYEAFPVEPKDLEKTLRSLEENNFVGVNLTIPHKEEAFKYVDEVSELAQKIGAINTITVSEGKLYGTNTDAYGFIENLKSCKLQVAGCKALVLGAGGAARAVCAGLLGEGTEVILVNRTFEKAQILAEFQNNKNIQAAKWEEIENIIGDIDLLVNTTSQGMKGEDPLTISLQQLPANAIVTDIVYNPLETPLLMAAKKRGNKTIDGLGMLLYQAQAAFNEWFGILPEVDEALRAHVLKGLT